MGLWGEDFLEGAGDRAAEIQASCGRTARQAVTVEGEPRIRLNNAGVRQRFDARISALHEVERDGAILSLDDFGAPEKP